MARSDAHHVQTALGREYARRYPAEAVGELERLPADETCRFLESLSAGEATRLIERLTPDRAGRVIALMDPARAGAVVAALDPASAARIVSRVDDELRERLLASLPQGLVAELRQLLAYPPHTAGALMDPEVLALLPEMTVREALKRLRELRHKRIHRLFVVGPDQRLRGSVRLRELAVAEPGDRLQDLAVTDLPGVLAGATREEVVDTLARTRAAVLPVVDFEGHLLGVLRHDALVDATREEATADIQSMVGAGKEERALSKVSLAVRKRLPWLQINLGTAFLAASVVGLFEETIARNTALAVLLPVVAGQSGNTGAQALAVTMRGLALREIRSRQWLRVCFKEAKVGMFNGLAVALTTALAVLLWSRSVGLALVIGVSMIVSMIAASLSGAGIPMILSSLGQDPAQSSSIILTTITDVVGFFSFLGIATLLASML